MERNLSINLVMALLAVVVIVTFILATIYIELKKMKLIGKSIELEENFIEKMLKVLELQFEKVDKHVYKIVNNEQEVDLTIARHILKKCITILVDKDNRIDMYETYSPAYIHYIITDYDDKELVDKYREIAKKENEHSYVMLNTSKRPDIESILGKRHSRIKLLQRI